ncbi:hypothetical protein K488DRAFT_72642 [Vararia minispora EC-137]|uniref:Uncharacterized protein n=1 Tax=Vararia minispora EC-137 TaxID=1314806 RepID=A0ACB8QDP1_9AGAM|nr:hypothetical protein K488DRAFT_72642 [Vararia minispora EC-137]
MGVLDPPSTSSLPTYQSVLSGDSHFQKIWEKALQEFGGITGSDLLQSPLLVEIVCAKSAEDIVNVLEAHEGGFKIFREHGKEIRAVVAPIVQLTELLVNTGSEVAAASGVVPGGKAIFVAFDVLLQSASAVLIAIQAAYGVSERYDTLEGLLVRLKRVLGRLNKHLRSRSTISIELETIFIDALVQLLKVLAICTKYLDGKSKSRISSRIPLLRRARDYGRALMGNKDVKDALGKLDDLTREELLVTAAQALVVVQEVAKDVKKMEGDVKAGVDAKEEQILSLELDKDIRDWLSPPDPTLRHEERRTLHLPGTCTWFFDDKYDEWKEGKNGVYWIYGNPGTGKSVLCSSIIENVLSTPDLRIAYYYFDYRRPEMQTVTGLFASLLYQLATSSPSCHKILKQFRLSLKISEVYAF